MAKVTIELELNYSWHWDADSGIYVIDIPALGIKTQASEPNIEASTKSAAQQWMQICADRKLFAKWKNAGRGEAAEQEQNKAGAAS